MQRRGSARWLPPSSLPLWQVATRKVGADGIGIISLVCQQRLWRSLRQGDQCVVGLAIGGFTDRPVEGDRLSSGIGQTLKLDLRTRPASSQERVDKSPFAASCRDVGTNGGAIDAAVTAVRHDLG